WDVIARVVKGYDPRLTLLPFYQQNAAALAPQLAGLEYIVNWAAMTLQDSIDFARSMVEITIAVQRFTHGIQSEPGAFPGVGGPIDIAVLRPELPLTWIAQKSLR